MGFNPMRKRVKRPSDILMVGSAMLIIAAIVAWAFFG
jgi:hypothetical protein